ncbi:hypothetical protein VitviT2T_002010 [Vitis vinifera]|uniref:RING-type domain-containing protein n=1 Tax=Vitis vinifera TaxID=29760 RepID=A0ABY9BHA9_VITVI|nr:hypothetical protein VitviT2T_002010 [Vitis vinifera]
MLFLLLYFFYKYTCSIIFIFILILCDMGTVHVTYPIHYQGDEMAMKCTYIVLIVGAISVTLLICYFILRLCIKYNEKNNNELDNQIRNIELNRVEINLFPISRFSEHEMYSECSICLDAFADGDEIIILLVCTHIYHTHCITSWFTSHSHCPLCRHDYSGYSLDDLILLYTI